MVLPNLLALLVGVNVEVDVGSARHPISPLIYGVNQGSDAQLQRMGITLRRFGGNGLSRYNFLTRSTNEGGDGRFFRNRPVDGGVEALIAPGRETVVELPVLGWVSSTDTGCGFSVAKYGPQANVSVDDPDCGDGVQLDGGHLSGNDPTDTSMAIDAGFVRSYVDFLLDAGVRYYALGNQPALWSSTHFDLHPSPSSYAEIRARLAEASGVVKAADPAAKTLGPSEWGWLNYFDSAAQDRASAGIDFIPYYLGEARLIGVATGRRPLDYLDLHVYPQAPVPDTTAIVRGDTSPGTRALRLRSTRTLWDPAYPVESWESCCFDTVLRIIPRMHEWIDAGYPGTGISISEYTWGALGDITGALAQADVLGIFGRERVDLAMLAGIIPDGALGEDAFKLYRNFDGAGRGFGSTSVKAASDDVTVGAYGSVEGARVYLVLINKSAAQSQQVDLTLSGGVTAAGAWSSFGFSASQRLTATGNGTFTNATLTRVLAPLSAELLELYPAGWDGGFGVPVMDAGFDAGVDAGTPDAGAPDAGAADGGPADAGGPDAGTGTGKGGCGCGSGGAPLLLAALALVRTLRRRRQSASRAVQ